MSGISMRGYATLPLTRDGVLTFFQERPFTSTALILDTEGLDNPKAWAFIDGLVAEGVLIRETNREGYRTA
jgi:hypothetical protein